MPWQTQALWDSHKQLQQTKPREEEEKSDVENTNTLLGSSVVLAGFLFSSTSPWPENNLISL